MPARIKITKKFALLASPAIPEVGRTVNANWKEILRAVVGLRHWLAGCAFLAAAGVSSDGWDMTWSIHRIYSDR